MEVQSDRGDNVLFAQLSEVKEASEFEESSEAALSKVRGSLRRHVEFWRSILVSLVIYYQLYARVTVCLFGKFPLSIHLAVIDQLWVILSLLTKLFWSFYIPVELWN